MKGKKLKIIYIMLIKIVIIGTLFSSLCYGTEATILTDAQNRSIKKETCKLIKNAFEVYNLGNTLSFPDFATKMILKNFKNSKSININNQFIVSISDCELEILTDSLTLNEIKSNLLNSNYKLLSDKMECGIPKDIDFNSKTTWKPNDSNMEKCTMFQYLNNKIQITYLNSHINAICNNFKIQNARFIRIDITPENYKKIKRQN
jgi:hypothetical protein